MRKMDQKTNACVAKYSMECGEQDKACDGSPTEKGKPPTQDQDHARTESPPLVSGDFGNLGDLPQSSHADIQEEIWSANPPGIEDVGDQALEHAPKIKEDIAELCLPQDDNPSLGDDSIPELLSLCDSQEKMDQETGNLVAEYSRGQEMACDDHPMEGEHVTQDQAKTKTLLSAPLDIGTRGDSSPSGPNDNTTETAGATAKEKCAGAEDLEQAPKIQEDISELCPPHSDNPSIQDDIVEEEEKLSLPTSLSSQEDVVTPRPPPDDEGANSSTEKLHAIDMDGCEISLPTSLSSQEDVITPRPPPDDEGSNRSTKKRIEMGVARKEIRYEGEEEVSQPMSLSSKDDEVQSQAIVSYKDDSQKIGKRSIKNDVKNFKVKYMHGKQYRRLNNEYLNDCKGCESSKTEIISLRNENSKLLKAHRRQCLRFVNYRLKACKERKCMRNDITDLQREVKSLKVDQNLQPSDGLDGDEAKSPTCEE